MRYTWSRLLVLAVASIALSAGCQHCGKKRCGPPYPHPEQGKLAPTTITAPPAPPTFPAAPTIPRAPTNQPAPPPAFPSPPATTTPPVTPRYYVPGGPVQTPWEPAKPQTGVRLSPPVAVDTKSENPATETNPVNPNIVQIRAPEAVVPTPSLPVGIPQFAYVHPRVANGLQPFSDGLDWLRSNGFRTVLHVHQPGFDDSDDRREVEKRGLTYTALEWSAETISSATFTAFSRQVSAPGNQPIFVYDRDGKLAGSLWYLHFRLIERLPDDQASTRAARLGFKADAQDRGMGAAVQAFLLRNS